MFITILGHVCIDHNLSEHIAYTSAGSPAMFMSRIYRQFPHVTTQIVAPYGSDFLPYVKNMSMYPIKPHTEKTLLYRNTVHRDVRTQKAFNREYIELLPITSELQAIIASSDVIFLAPLTPDYSVEYVRNVMLFAKKNTLKVLLPQGYYRTFDHENNVHQREFNEAEELLPLFDVMIVSDEDHHAIAEYAKKWAQKIQVIITKGDKGAHYFYKNEIISAKTDPVDPKNIIDSVGSGDIFSASFGYMYYKTNNIQKSLGFANNIARQCLFYKSDSLKIILP